MLSLWRNCDEYIFWTEDRWTVSEIILLLRTLIGILPQVRNCDLKEIIPQLRNCERDPSSTEELWERSFLCWGIVRRSFLSWGTFREIIPQLRNRERVPTSAEVQRKRSPSFAGDCDRDPSSAKELRERSFLSWGTTKEILLLGNCDRDPSSAEDLWEISCLSRGTTRDPSFAKKLW